jgi:hypothetical protein
MNQREQNDEFINNVFREIFDVNPDQSSIEEKRSILRHHPRTRL